MGIADKLDAVEYTEGKGLMFSIPDIDGLTPWEAIEVSSEPAVDPTSIAWLRWPIGWPLTLPTRCLGM